MKKTKSFYFLMLNTIFLISYQLKAEDPYKEAKQFTPFMDELTIPKAIKPTKSFKDYDEYSIDIVQKEIQLYKNATPTKMWTYAGQFPGPTFEIKKGRKIKVKWNNKLPSKHVLPVDEKMFEEMSKQNPEEKREKENERLEHSRTITHLHGGLIEAKNDGASKDWVSPGESFTTIYNNNQDAELLWYHDHAMDLTHLNAYAGLAGAYIIRDENEARLKLPSGKYEIPLVVSAKTFKKDMQLYYPDVMPPEMYGQTAMVNDKIMPYLNVEPRVYRFRLLNGSNARYFNLFLQLEKQNNLDIPMMIQIGADGGLFEKKVTIGASKGNFDLEGLKIAPGMRADLLIDFSKFKGQNLILKNNYKNALVEPVISEMNKVSIIDNIMQFRVGANVTEAYQLNLPAKLRTISKLSETEQIVATKDFLIKELDESMCITKPAEQIKGSTTFFGLPYRWQLIDEEKTLQNTTEIWRFINLTGDPHPIHIHQGSFQVVAREKVDMKMYEKNKNLHMLKSSRRMPEKNELGFRDIAMVYPGETLEIAKKFYIKGKFLYHCHILEHEDMGMMRFFEVN